MSDTADIDTLPPGPPDDEVDRSVDVRLSLEDRQMATSWKILEILKIQKDYAHQEVGRHASLDEALKQSANRQEMLLSAVTGMRKEQIKLSQKIEAVESSVHELATRLDGFSVRLDAQETRENGAATEARQRIIHDAETAREVIAQDAGAAKQVLEQEADAAREKLKD